MSERVNPLVAPLVRMFVEVALVEFIWRLCRFPIFCEGIFAPSCFRTNLFLSYIMAPSAARDAASTAHQQDIDDGTIRAVRLEPLVNAGSHQTQARPLSLRGGRRKLSGQCNGVLSLYAGNFFPVAGVSGNIVRVAFAHSPPRPRSTPR